jgi:integrase
MTRRRYQNGWLDERDGLWYYRYRDKSAGTAPSIKLGECANKSEAWRRAERYSSKANGVQTQTERGIMVNDLVKQYRESTKFPARFSTAQGYNSNLDNHILPEWGKVSIKEIDAEKFEGWLDTLDYAPKTKVHLRGLMAVLIKFAMFKKHLPKGINEMKFVTIKGASKREEEPRILTVDEFHSLLACIDREPYRTFTLTAMCVGPRFSEIDAFKWEDLDVMKHVLWIRRSIVRGYVDEVKTRHSGKPMPVDPYLEKVLLAWRGASEFNQDSDWMWASPFKGGTKPLLYSTMLWHLQRAGRNAGLGTIGWHTFRHTFRSWVDETGASAGVQQRLMRHADIRTTFNIYGDAVSSALRETHGKVVRMASRNHGAA